VSGDVGYTPAPVRRQIRYRNFRDDRTYYIDGEMYPSVTAVLSILARPALVGWAARVEREAVIRATDELIREYRANGRFPPTGEEWAAMVERRLTHVHAARRELLQAGAIGTAVHARIEWEMATRLGLDAGPEPRLTGPAARAHAAWKEWERSNALTPLAIELVVHSRTHRYAGALDLLAEVNGTVAVVDFKTGGAVYREALIQNAAYRWAVHELGLAPSVPGGLIVRLPKDQEEPVPEIVPVTGFDHLFRLFLALREAYDLLAAIDAVIGEGR